MRSPNDFGDAETGIKPWLTACIRMGMHFCDIRWPRFIGARLNAQPGSTQRRMHSPPAIHGCVILTKLGKCLAQCTHGSRASDVQTATLCQLVATMQDVGGSLQFGYLELHGLGVVLQQGYRVTIAVLCDPEHGQASARLVAMQALNVFGSERGTQTRTPPQKPSVPTLRPLSPAVQLQSSSTARSTRWPKRTSAT